MPKSKYKTVVWDAYQDFIKEKQTKEMATYEMGWQPEITVYPSITITTQEITDNTDTDNGSN